MTDVFLCDLHTLVLPYRYPVIPSQYYFLNIWEKLCCFIQIFSLGKICPILQCLSYFSVLSWLPFRPSSSLPKTPVVNIPLKIFHRTEYVSPDSIKPVKNSVYTIFCTLYFCDVYHRRMGHSFLQSLLNHWKEMKRCIYTFSSIIQTLFANESPIFPGGTDWWLCARQWTSKYLLTIKVGKGPNLLLYVANFKELTFEGKGGISEWFILCWSLANFIDQCWSLDWVINQCMCWST